VRTLLVAAAAGLLLAEGAAAEVVARGVQDGMLATTRAGRPAVAYIRGPSLAVATRTGAHRWRTVRAAAVTRGSTVAALESGTAGTVVLVQSADARRLQLVRQVGPGWAVTELAGRLAIGTSLGPPGLALDPHGLAAVAYTRWHAESHKSNLVLARLDRSGHVRTQQITQQGFPKSHVAPPAAPVFTRGVLHVIESYGYDGAVGTIDWGPKPKPRRGWSGQFIDSGIGDFPVGPLLSAVGPHGTVYAAWTEALLGTGEYPVLLAANGREIQSDVLLDRALTTGLIAPASGVVVAANEWVTAAQLGLENGGVTWAGTIASRGKKTELDGWVAGLARRGGARDLLLAGPGGLSWFTTPAAPAVHLRLTATANTGGSVALGGRVQGYTSGRVTIYRERPGFPRAIAGAVTPARDGSFTFTDRRPLKPLLYRAVYSQPKTGVPYAALLRTPVD